MIKFSYTKEDVEELKTWFETHELPASMQINDAAFSPDLKRTVSILLEQAAMNYRNDKMHGSLHLLEQIRQNIEKGQSAGE